VRFVRNATNLGFTAGNNVGYATSRGQAIYFLNPDTELVDTPTHARNPDASYIEAKPDHEAKPNGESSLWTLYRGLMDNPTVGLVGPQLRYANNSLQSSRRRFPTPLSSFFGSEALGRYWHNNPWQRRLQMDEWPATFRQETDWLVGAAMLARRSALEEIRQPEMSGPFDEGFFMYSEETDLCKRLKERGWRIVYVPDVVVIHYEGQSSGQVLAARDIHFQRSKIRYQRKYFGPLWAEALRVFYLWNLRGQIVIESAKLWLGHKREMRAARVDAYRQVLATKLRPEEKTDSARTQQ
jgi:GT2 family glycosyltransferase